MKFFTFYFIAGTSWSAAKSKKAVPEAEVDVEGGLPKNGIESLLKASALTIG